MDRHDDIASSEASDSRSRSARAGNTHATVKPTSLMRYLCRLITPPSGTIVDPFMGSGSTGRGAILEGFCFIGIEREPEYFAIAERRIARAAEQPDLFRGEAADMRRTESGSRGDPIRFV